MENRMMLKIIDWDSGHFVNEELSDPMSATLGYRKHLIIMFQLSEAEATVPVVYDWVYYYLMESNINNHTFCSRNKEVLDMEFKDARQRLRVEV